MFGAMKKSRKKPKHKKENAIGLAWYSRQQWEILKQVADDAEGLAPTFARWEANAKNAARMLRQSGYAVEIVDIDVTELLQWCKSNNRPLDGEARSDFVEEKIQDSRFARRPGAKDRT